MVVSVIYSLYLKGEFQNITKTVLPTYLYVGTLLALFTTTAFFDISGQPWERDFE